MPFDLHRRSIVTSSSIVEVVKRVNSFFHASPLAFQSFNNGCFELFIADLHLVANFHVFHELCKCFIRTKSNYDEFQVISPDHLFIVCIFIENFLVKIFDFFLLVIKGFTALMCLCGRFFNQHIFSTHFDGSTFCTFFDGLAIGQICGSERGNPRDSQGNTAFFRS